METCYFTECIIHEPKGVIGARRKGVKRLVPRKNIFTYKQYLNSGEKPSHLFPSRTSIALRMLRRRSEMESVRPLV